MFIKSLFTMAKMWTHPKCPGMDEWVKNKLYISMYTYNGLLCTMKKNKIL